MAGCPQSICVDEIFFKVENQSETRVEVCVVRQHTACNFEWLRGRYRGNVRYRLDVNGNYHTQIKASNIVVYVGGSCNGRGLHKRKVADLDDESSLVRVEHDSHVLQHSREVGGPHAAVVDTTRVASCRRRTKTYELPSISH